MDWLAYEIIGKNHDWKEVHYKQEVDFGVESYKLQRVNLKYGSIRYSYICNKCGLKANKEKNEMILYRHEKTDDDIKTCEQIVMENILK